MKTLFADTTNGLSTTGDDDYVTDVVSERLFLSCLSDLPDEDYLRCDEISDDTYNSLSTVYGIR